MGIRPITTWSIYVSQQRVHRIGVTNPERDAQVAAALCNRKVKDVCAEFGIHRSTARAMERRHKRTATYDVSLSGNGMKPFAVCTVVSTRGHMSAAILAYRSYPGLLKHLELPGWRLNVGDASFELEAIRREIGLRRHGE